MLRLIPISLLLILSLACERSQNEKEEKSPVDEPEAPTVPCQSTVELLPNNRFYEKELNRLVRILPAGKPGAHRRVQVLATPDCRVLLDTLIGGNEDYDHQLAQITYNLSSKLIGIKSKGAVHCVDLSDNSLLPPLVPEFAGERMSMDAQSGQIVRLEVWEDFLIGYARDFGAFVFDMRDHRNPRPVLPYSEYAAGDTRFVSLFLLPSEAETYQALVPVYRPADDVFDINPAFEEPEPLVLPAQRQKPSMGRSVVLEKRNGGAIELDLAKYLN